MADDRPMELQANKRRRKRIVRTLTLAQTAEIDTAVVAARKCEGSAALEQGLEPEHAMRRSPG